MLLYSPFSIEHKHPQAAAQLKEEVHFCVTTSIEYEAIVFVIKKDGGNWIQYPCKVVSVAENGTKQVCVVWMAEEEGLYFYKFYAKGTDGTIISETPTYQQTVYSNSFMTPKWLSGALMYQIFPDRFKRSQNVPIPTMNKDWVLREVWGEDPVWMPDENGIVKNNDFFAGNLKGIEEELAYLSGLGVTIIYLNPIFEAYSNHRYDTADYLNIDPLLGSYQDFKDLCEAAKSFGIRIILDGVFNHTGSHSIYFNKDGLYDTVGAYQSKDSVYYPWYSFGEWPNNYASWWGIDTLPNLREEHPDVLDYFIRSEDSVVAYWLRAGASGFRLDVADELPDGFLDALRKKVKEINPDACILGEVWEDASNKIAYGSRRRYFGGAQLDSVMNYPVKDSMLQFFTNGGDGEALANLINTLQDHYPKPAFMSLMNILGTHDTDRIRTVLSRDVNDDEGKRRLYAALLIWAFLPGSACIYYGDEIGMQGTKDPMNRRCFEQDWGDEDITEYYKKLLAFRKEIDNLGDMEMSEIEGGKGIFSFVRRLNRVKLCVYINMSDEEVVFNVESYAEHLGEIHSGNIVFREGSIALSSKSAVCLKLFLPS
ncbi:MAG: glycoside hydrolase family 13 protein [Clostridia bacterium]|nr:glycoside hydrolase family 13 protein [Clostridia bacterium]